MYYVNDNGHRNSGGDGFAAGLSAALDAADGGVLYLEDVTVDPATKEAKEALYNAFLDGEAEVVPPEEMRRRIADGAYDVDDPDEWPDGAYALATDEAFGRFHRGLTDSRIEALDVLAAHRDAVDRVDVGPVHDFSEAALDRAMRVWDAARGGRPSARDQRHAAELRRRRDRNWTQYLEREAETDRVDPDEAVVVMGGAHNLDDRLRGSFDVTVTNDSRAGAESLTDRIEGERRDDRGDDLDRGHTP